MSVATIQMLSLCSKLPTVKLSGAISTNAKSRHVDHVLTRTARVILHDKAAELNSTTYSATGILPFGLLSTVKCLSTTHQLLQRDCAESFLLPLFSATSSQSERLTCSTDGQKFILPKHMTSMVEQCFHYHVEKCWNNLPSSIAANQFNKLKSTHLLSALPV